MFETHTFTAEIGGSKLETKFTVRRPPTAASERDPSGRNDVVANVVFTVDGRTDTTATKNRRPQRKVWRILGTVQNSFAEFVLNEAAKGKAFAVEFTTPTERLADFFAVIAPRLGRAYGVEVETSTIQLGKRIARKVTIEYPERYDLTQPYISNQRSTVA